MEVRIILSWALSEEVGGVWAVARNRSVDVKRLA